MNSDKTADFLTKLASRSNVSLRPDIVRGVIPLPSVVASSDEMAIIEQ